MSPPPTADEPAPQAASKDPRLQGFTQPGRDNSRTVTARPTRPVEASTLPSKRKVTIMLFEVNGATEEVPADELWWPRRKRRRQTTSNHSMSSGDVRIYGRELYWQTANSFEDIVSAGRKATNTSDAIRSRNMVSRAPPRLPVVKQSPKTNCGGIRRASLKRQDVPPDSDTTAGAVGFKDFNQSRYTIDAIMASQEETPNKCTPSGGSYETPLAKLQQHITTSQTPAVIQPPCNSSPEGSAQSLSPAVSGSPTPSFTPIILPAGADLKQCNDAYPNQEAAAPKVAVTSVTSGCDAAADSNEVLHSPDSVESLRQDESSFTPHAYEDPYDAQIARIKRQLALFDAAGITDSSSESDTEETVRTAKAHSLKPKRSVEDHSDAEGSSTEGIESIQKRIGRPGSEEDHVGALEEQSTIWPTLRRSHPEARRCKKVRFAEIPAGGWRMMMVESAAP
jgi:hypothetical protein